MPSLLSITDMIRFKKVTLFGLLVTCASQFGLVRCQWYGSPYNNQNCNYGQTYTLPVQYVPAQGPINQEIQGYPGQVWPPLAPNICPPFISNEVPGSAYGLEEARAIQSAYPNQPVIIINNGGFGGTRAEEDSGFDFEELLPLLFAVNGGEGLFGGGGKHHHHHHQHSHPEASEKETSDPTPDYPGFYPGYPYPYPYPYGYPGMPGMPGSADGGKDGVAGEIPVPKPRPTTVTNITIVLPDLRGTNVEISSKDKDEEVTVKAKSKKEKKDEDDE